MSTKLLEGGVDVCNPLIDGKTALSKMTTKSTSNCRDSLEVKSTDEPDTKVKPEELKLHPMAFTIDFGDGKTIDKQRLEHLAKQSQARHQRVQSMSASFTASTAKTSPFTSQTKPMSAKLPRKTQGYNSEGYFSSDQEDSVLSGSVKLRQSPLAQNTQFKPHKVMSPVKIDKQSASPTNDLHRKSKSPIVDSIMSRSDILPSRQSLNLPLKGNTGKSVLRTPSYGNLQTHSRKITDIIDRSPETLMLTDVSSPELDLLTPDNGLNSPEYKTPVPMPRKNKRVSPESKIIPELKKPLKPDLFIDDDVEKQSNSSAGTYTIEAEYSEEQKARMSIDGSFGTSTLESRRSASNERDPELIFDCGIKHQNKIFSSPKVLSDKNVLEVSYCYESPTEDLAAQTSKQIKSTRNYLEKVKNRVKTITERTFQKPKDDKDHGTFTAVTTSGVLSSSRQDQGMHRRPSYSNLLEQGEYMQRLTRESSVPVYLPGNLEDTSSQPQFQLQITSKTDYLPNGTLKPLEICEFGSTALKTAQARLKSMDRDLNNSDVVGKLSYLSLNRCKGDKTWIQEWADSVKKYNNDVCKDDLNTTFTLENGNSRGSSTPRSPKQYTPPKSNSTCTSPSKIPSPVAATHRNQMTSSADTENYLLRTQHAITNLQAKLAKPNPLTSSFISEKTSASKLPVSQLSRSNSLNYRLRKKEAPADTSPLRSPGNYVVTGCGIPAPAKLLLKSATKSFEDNRNYDSNMNSPERCHSSPSNDTILNKPPINANSPTRKHLRHKSFDGRNPNEFFNSQLQNANAVSLKSVLKNNAFESQLNCIDQTFLLNLNRYPRPYNTNIKRSSSFSTVNKNNNFEFSRRSSQQSDILDYLSDESDTSEAKMVPRRGRIDSPDLKPVPANSPKCPSTPELQRKFGPGLVRNSVRVTNKERLGPVARRSEPPQARVSMDWARQKEMEGEKNRKLSEATRQAIVNRLTKSRSSTREPPKLLEKAATRKPSQYRSSTSLAVAAAAAARDKEHEFNKWKKRASYDPMKAAMQGKRRQRETPSTEQRECEKDDLSSPSQSSPVHRSQSFHSGGLMVRSAGAGGAAAAADDLALHLQLELESVSSDEWATHTQPNKPSSKATAKRDVDKRKTFIIDDDVAPARDKAAKRPGKMAAADATIDKRKTFIVDSDNSTTNGSSPRNSSIFSHEKNSFTTTGTSDTENDSGPESAPVVLRQPRPPRQPRPAGNTQPASANPHRHSGDFSGRRAGSAAAGGCGGAGPAVQPRYLDISKYRAEEGAHRNFLRRDPSKTYVALLPAQARAAPPPTPHHLQLEAKKQELEKWRRRASYDPRKAAAQGRRPGTAAAAPPPAHALPAANSVLRSQSFHGPLLQCGGGGGGAGAGGGGRAPLDCYDNSDNDF